LNNKVKIYFKVSEYNGYPNIKIFLNNHLLADQTFSNDLWNFEFEVSQALSNCCLRIERYGKTDCNYSQEKDQVVEIIAITVDGISIPEYILVKQSKFEFDGQIHIGSLYFGPNGIWTFDFATPIITHILDQKIHHESQYNQDYQYPWSYKLGPNSVNSILSNIEHAVDQVNKL
jgi:hypothetical protein